MAFKKKVITVPKGAVDGIRRSLNVDRATVYNALAYRSNSETAQQIRRLATSTYGGIETTKVVFN